MNETAGQRVPVDYFRVGIDRLPRPQRVVFGILTDAAALGGELYLEQLDSLRPYRGQLEELAKDDPLAHHPLTIPRQDGRFIPLWRHPAQKQLLGAARRLQLRAAQEAERAGLKSLAEYLHSSSRDLTRGNYDRIKIEYVRLVGSVIDYHLLPIEQEAGFDNKQFWQGFLGLIDLVDTVGLRDEIERLREIGAADNNGQWYTPETNISIDNVAVMSGWLGLLAQQQRRRQQGFLEGGGISAQNFPNEAHLARTAGTRSIIYEQSFQEVCRAIAADSRPYLAPILIPTVLEAARFLGSHELAHDERYPNDLGWLHSAARESYANQAAIVAAAEAWGQESDLFQSRVKGALGYALRDSSPYLNMDPMPDLVALVEKSSHVPGNLGWLHQGIKEKAFILEDGVIVAVNWGRILTLSRALAQQERELLRQGTVNDVVQHFKEILPKRPFPFDGQDGDLKPRIFPRPKLPRWPWSNPSSQSASSSV